MNTTTALFRANTSYMVVPARLLVIVTSFYNFAELLFLNTVFISQYMRLMLSWFQVGANFAYFFLLHKQF